MTRPAYVVGDGPTGVLVLSGSSGRVESSAATCSPGSGESSRRRTAGSARPSTWCPGVLRRAAGAAPRALRAARRARHLARRRGRAAPRCAAPRGRRGRRDLAQRRRLGLAVAASGRSARRGRAAASRCPFVPYDDAWVADHRPAGFLDHYLSCLDRFADRVPAARIPVERIARRGRAGGGRRRPALAGADFARGDRCARDGGRPGDHRRHATPPRATGSCCRANGPREGPAHGPRRHRRRRRRARRPARGRTCSTSCGDGAVAG